MQTCKPSVTAPVVHVFLGASSQTAVPEGLGRVLDELPWISIGLTACTALRAELSMPSPAARWTLRASLPAPRPAFPYSDETVVNIMHCISHLS